MNTISLLNCFYREDVITDLICNLINLEENFAKWFLENICNVDTENGKFKARTRVGLGKGIGTPDLVIERKNNSATDLIIVIENKLGALEGAEQTNRYASSEGKEKLYSILRAEKSVPVHFLFLTLDPYTPAENPMFDKKDYRGFVNVDWHGLLQNEAAIFVITDFSSLIKDFYEPINSAKLTDHIAETMKSLDSLQRKLIWIKMLQQVQDQWPNELETTFGEAGGFGRNAAVFGFGKKEWSQDYFDGSRLSPNSMNIHFELSINLLNSSAIPDFALHYEPNPYKPKREYVSVEGYKEYEHLRDRRSEEFHKLINQLQEKELYTIRKGSNSLLRVNIKENKRFEDIINELVKIMDQLTPLVDHIVNTN